MILELSGNCIGFRSWRLLKSNFVIIIFRLDQFKIWKKKYHYASRPTSFPRVNFIGTEGTASPRESPLLLSNEIGNDFNRFTKRFTRENDIGRITSSVRARFNNGYGVPSKDRKVRRNTTVILYDDPSIWSSLSWPPWAGGGGQYPRTRDPSRKR